MEEIAHAVNSSPVGRRDMEKLITIEMAEIVFSSNHFKRLGVSLDETLPLCLFVFAGDEGLDWRKWIGMPIRIDVLLFVHGLSDNDVEAPNARRNLTHFSFGPPGLVRRLSFGHVERQSSTPPLFSTWSTFWLRRTRT